MIKESLIWFLEQISYLTEQALSWKLIGDFSLLHFILGFNFLIILFSFYKFGIDTTGDVIGTESMRMRNAENYKQRLDYKRSYEYYSANRQARESNRKRWKNEHK